MSDALLATKLYIPPAPPGLVARPALVARLNEGLARRLTLISAPAGFGKTTLLSEWIGQSEALVAWFSLDEGDNDVARFLAYLVAALQKIEPGVGETTLAAFQIPQPPALDLALTPLLNDLSAIRGPFAIVLDDLHLVRSEPVYQALGFLLDHLPPQGCLVIATRADPPLGLSRLRGSGQLVELRAADLRFTPDEAPTFLNQVMGLALSQEDIAALEARTEGWVAGLQLAALSMRQSRDARAFIKAFSGGNEYIMDYLTDEVLSQQPEEVRSFLLQTSIQDRLTGPLCDAITGQANGQRMLESLRAANLFLIPLDDERRWYRYHHLMADLLRATLQEADPRLVLELHRRASLWHEQNGLIPEAIEHALKAADFERAAALIGRIAEEMLMYGQIATLLGWAEALPVDVVRRYPRVSVMIAAGLLLMGRPMETIEEMLKDVSEGVETATFRAVLSTFRGDVQEGARLSREVLGILPEDSQFFRTVAVWTLAMSGMLDGRLEESVQTLNEAAHLAEKAGNVIVAVVAHCHSAEMAMALGRLGEAEMIYRQSLEMAADSHGRPLPAISFAEVGLGEVLRERNDLDTAERLLEDGIRHGGQSGVLGLMDGYIALARLRQARGDAAGANQAIRTAQEIAARFDATDIDDAMVALNQIRLWIAQGDVEAARHSFNELGLGQADPVNGGGSGLYLTNYQYWLSKVGAARLLLASQKPGEALMMLAPLIDTLDERGWVTAEIEALALQALAHQAQGDIDQALAALERALRMAEPEGYARIFLDEGEPMARLLEQAAGRGIAPDYARRLLAQFPGAASTPPQTASQAGLVEPLSERELEVLRLISGGFSNDEIGRKLFLALPTVKWHTGNIFGKLGVRNRVQAVARARELGLLPDQPTGG